MHKDPGTFFIMFFFYFCYIWDTNIVLFTPYYLSKRYSNLLFCAL